MAAWVVGLVRAGDDDLEGQGRPLGPFLVEQVDALDGIDRVGERPEVALAEVEAQGRDGHDEQQRRLTATKARIGRRMTARTTTAHTPLPSGRSRPRNGMRSRSTPSPRMARVAGRNVSEPMTAMSTTEIVPMAIDWNRMSSRRNRPAIENMTASPEKNTARPAVAEATRMASDFVASVASLGAVAGDHEQRVVDRDGQPDEHDRAGWRTG